MGPATTLPEALLDSIYQAPLEQPPWRDCLRSLMQTLGADGAILMLRRPNDWDRGVILLEGLPGLEGELGANIYGDQMYAADPFVNLPANQVVTLDEYTDIRQLEDSEFYRLCLEPFGIYHILGVDLQADEAMGAVLRLTRKPEASAFDSADRELLGSILPHLKRALRIHSRLDHVENERQLYADTVSQFSVATLLLDEQQQLVNSNAMGEQILAQGDGIRLHGQQLELDRHSDNRQLKLLVKQALAARQQNSGISTQAMPLHRPSGKTDYGLVIRPLPIGSIHRNGEAAVVVFISDPEQALDSPQQAALSQLFGLTPAESRLAQQLANGLSLDDACLALHISRNTGRAHLRSIFSKTGVSQQSQLVRLILKSAANLGNN